MDRLSDTFQALADPTRRAILARLAQGEASVNDLAKPFAISQPAISKHLKVLERAGLISRSRDAQYRPCRLEPQALKRVDAWLEVIEREKAAGDGHVGPTGVGNLPRPMSRGGCECAVCSGNRALLAEMGVEV